MAPRTKQAPSVANGSDVLAQMVELQRQQAELAKKMEGLREQADQELQAGVSQLEPLIEAFSMGPVAEKANSILAPHGYRMIYVGVVSETTKQEVTKALNNGDGGVADLDGEWISKTAKTLGVPEKDVRFTIRTMNQNGEIFPHTGGARGRTTRYGLEKEENGNGK